METLLKRWWLDMSKPKFISHYLVLIDLIKGVDVRKHSDSIVYLTSRIENIKNSFVNEGLLFDEKAQVKSKFSYYKPYVLVKDESNINNAIKLLDKYGTDKVLNFLSQANINETKNWNN